MAQVIDLSENKYAQQAGDNIVKIIEASAKAKQSQIDLQKQLLLDQITRKRNLEDKQSGLEMEQNIKNKPWTSLLNQQGNPETNNSGVANAATPNQVGDNPNAPVAQSPIGGEIPQGGYTPQQPPPMSMADGSNQPQIQQMQVQPTMQQEAQVSKQKGPSYQIKQLGYQPVSIDEVRFSKNGAPPEAIDYNYARALMKLERDIATPGDIRVVNDYNKRGEDVKDKREERLAKQQNISSSTRIRQEFINRPEVKEFVTAKNYTNMMDAQLDRYLKNKKDYGSKVALDQSLISPYNKLLDPASVTMVSEYARTSQDIGLFNRFNGAIDKLKNGGAGLTDEDRIALVKAAKVILNSRSETYNQTLDEYKNLSNELGLDPKIVTRNMSPYEENIINNESTSINNSFSSEEEAAAAGLPDGTKITINGVSGTWRN